MKDLVLIPSYFRPEFLYLTLEQILKADGGAEKHVWIAQDRKTTDLSTRMNLLSQVQLVAKLFEDKFAKFRYIERQPHSYIGNPLNFLELYREAFAEREVRYVYLIEDDVIVGKDFFRWHEAVQEKFSYEMLCSVGWHCTRNKTVEKSNDPHAVISSARDFTSIGVCWPHAALTYLVKHAVVDYYSNLHAHMAKNFPGGPIPSHQWTEQAGLIMRILLEQRGRKVVIWPGIRRCSHIGFNGYHRRNGFQFSGGLQNKIQQLRAVIHSTKAMRELSKEFYEDIDELPKLYDWTADKLRIVQKIPYDGSFE